jgi:hypothetical protein
MQLNTQPHTALQQPFCTGKATVEAIPGHLSVIKYPLHLFNKLRSKCLVLKAIELGNGNTEYGVFAACDLEPRWLVADYYGYCRITRDDYFKLHTDDPLRMQVDTHGLSLGSRGDIIVGVTGANINDRCFRNREICGYGSLINETRGTLKHLQADCRIVYTVDHAYIFMVNYVRKGLQVLMSYGSAGDYMP